MKYISKKDLDFLFKETTASIVEGRREARKNKNLTEEVGMDHRLDLLEYLKSMIKNGYIDEKDIITTT